jgi:hypothetical protein
MRRSPAVLIAFVIVRAVLGQTYTISTFAGGLAGSVRGTYVGLGPVNSVAVDSNGNVLFVASGYSGVLRLDGEAGALTVAAGIGLAGFNGDGGPSIGFLLNGPQGAAVDSAGNYYIADTYNNRICKVSNGVVTTIAGTGVYGFSGDGGPAISAQLNLPTSVAVDSASNVYIADLGNGRIREVSNGVITTFAGNGTQGFSGDNGLAADAQLWNPEGVAVDSAGNVYIADTGNHRVREVSNGVIATIAGNGKPGFGGDGGPSASAQLSYPYGAAVDSVGNVYIADTGNSRIRRVSNGVVTTVAGNGTWGFSGDNGPAISAGLYSPFGVAVDSAGEVYIADTDNFRVRKVSNGVITTVAGNGTWTFGGDGGPAISAQVAGPTGAAVDSAGSVYIADTGNNRVRKVSNGVITTVAGNGTQGFSGDGGPASNSQLSYPAGVALDSEGNLYIADTGNERVRKVANGVIGTIAGGGSVLGDNGPAANAQLNAPSGVAVDATGNLYIADSQNNRIRQVSNGVIATFAGDGTAGFSGDNGPATSAQLDLASGVTVDSAGNVYIADTHNHRVREVSNGVITTVAGDGTNGFSGDHGPASIAQLNNPYGVAVSAAGTLYIADAWNNRIREVSNGVITSIAGGGSSLGDYNGPATSVELVIPKGVAVDSACNVYVADSGNHVWLLTPSGTTTLTPPSTPSIRLPITSPAPSRREKLGFSLAPPRALAIHLRSRCQSVKREGHSQ